MTVALRVIGAELPEGPIRLRYSGQFLRRFDVEWHDGLAPFPMTTEIAEAAWFPSLAEALDFWKTQSVVVPLRLDGEPNRPLTALTVEIVPIPTAPDVRV